MKIKKIKQIQINSMLFDIEGDKTHSGASVFYGRGKINIGIKVRSETYILEVIMHEIFEIITIDMHVRLSRPDCDSDYIFVFDHRQHATIQAMMAGIISKFIM